MNLQNLINYGKDFDIDILSGVQVPAPLSNDTMKSAIMIRCGLLTPVYGEPELFRDMVTHWFTVKQWTIEHLINVINAEYSPIENYDRYEDITDSSTGSETEHNTGRYNDTHSGTDMESSSGTYNDTHSGNDKESSSGTDTEKSSGKYNDTHSGNDKESNSGNIKNNDTTENTVSAYNSSSYQPDTKETVSKNETHADDKTFTHGHKLSNTHEDNKNFTHENDKTFTHGHKLSNTHEDDKTFTHGHTLSNTHEDDKTVSRSGDNTRTAHLHGNIGVTTNQQLIEQELELLRHFDIYGYIAERFEEDNMLMIY